MATIQSIPKLKTPLTHSVNNTAASSIETHALAKPITNQEINNFREEITTELISPTIEQETSTLRQAIASPSITPMLLPSVSGTYTDTYDPNSIRFINNKLVYTCAGMCATLCTALEAYQTQLLLSPVNINGTLATTVEQALHMINTARTQVNVDWDASSGVSAICNKPVLARVATLGTYNSLTDKPNFAAVAYSGCYCDLCGLPTIPAAQINSDWLATEGVALIRNKPELSCVACSGNYNDLLNKPDLSLIQQQSDWTQSNSNCPTYIKNKPELARVATSGLYADLTGAPAIPEQVNSDWNATSGKAQILNKPSLSVVAISGDYNDLRNIPPDASKTYTFSFDVSSHKLAVTEHGLFNDTIIFNDKIDTAYSFEYNDNTLTITDNRNNTYTVNLGTEFYTKDEVDSLINAITDLIPAQASSSNQLADKNFVNSSIGTNTANYISNQGEPFTSLAQLQAYTGTVTNNDYAFVTGTDESGNKYFDRYKATVNGTTVSWGKEYRLNNSSFTAVQWAAINSGITSSKVAEIDSKEPAITKLPISKGGTNATTAKGAEFNINGGVSLVETDMNDGAAVIMRYGTPSASQGTFFYRTGANIWNWIKNHSNALYAAISHTHTKSQITDFPNLATVATSGSYNDLTNKPTIPAAQVNSDWNATSGKAQILNKPAIPTKTSDLTNDSNFVSDADYVHTDNNFTTEKLKILEAELPTDAILHYSFDEVPDLPDGTNVILRNKNFSSTSEITSLRASKTITNGILKMQQNVTNVQYGIGFRFGTLDSSDVKNKIVVCKLFVSTAVAGNIYFRSIGHSSNTTFYNQKIEQNKWVTVTFVLPSDADNPWFAILGLDSSLDNYVLFEAVYIGNGTYDTSVIDNVNGQYNGTNNGVLAVEGVSGKGGYTLTGNRSHILTKCITNKDVTYHFWFSLETSHSGQFNIMNNGSSSGSYGIRIGSQSGNRLGFFTPSTQWKDIISTTDFQLKKWYCVDIVFNNSLGKIYCYLDGVYVHGFDGVIPDNFDETVGLQICGTNLNVNYTPNAKYDDFQIFDRALSEKEILGLYLARGNTPKYYTQSVAAQIQSDWAQSDASAKDFIKNKPNLATVATSGSYNDLSNKPTIPAVNNKTITLCHGTTCDGSFTLNQTANCTITLPAYPPDLSNCAGLNCTGTVVAGDIANFITDIGVKVYCSTTCKCTLYKASSLCLGSNAFNSTAFTTCKGTVTKITLGNSTCSPDTSGNITLPSYPPDLSNCAGLNCTGTLVPSDLSGYATETWVTNKGYTTCTGTVTGISVYCGTTCKCTIKDSCSLQLGTMAWCNNTSGIATYTTINFNNICAGAHCICTCVLIPQGTYGYCCCECWYYWVCPTGIYASYIHTSDRTTDFYVSTDSTWCQRYCNTGYWGGSGTAIHWCSGNSEYRDYADSRTSAYYISYMLYQALGDTMIYDVWFPALGIEGHGCDNMLQLYMLDVCCRVSVMASILWKDNGTDKINYIDNNYSLPLWKQPGYDDCKFSLSNCSDYPPFAQHYAYKYTNKDNNNLLCINKCARFKFTVVHAPI